ncbi:sestrin-1-like isoform X2 [Acipenser ruthenus]|uniref:sestrin-1-like isoform X2 n=1 Tax=Acipenser ruthenus TaxID=7906 RepID=UPI00145B7EB1|nr:sestrin-1-like isoform X2 [Acipenser ruthenus]
MQYCVKYLQYCKFSMDICEGAGMWDGLGSRDTRSREMSMENISQEVLRRAEKIGPISKEVLQPLRSPVSSPDGLNWMLARLLMLSRRCPYADVREKCLSVLQIVQDIGVRIPRPLEHGPSRFIPEKEILQVSKVNAKTQAIFEDAFAALGRLDNISLVMGFHPKYLESFLRTQHYLLQMDGPLSLHCRHYIGIMAAARHQCSYLVNLHVNDFLQVGGDSKWLNGLEDAPEKLQHLEELNKILAHRPWLVTKAHIEQLLKAEEHSWSLAELIHAVVLLTHYHSLASFTFGCGISPEIHCDGGHTFRPPSVSNYCTCDIANGNDTLDEIQGNHALTDALCEVEALMEKMKQLQECRDEEASQEEMATRFETEKTESMRVAAAEEEDSVPARDVSRHFEDTSYGYKDFSRRGEHVPTFRAQDYSWEDHGYSLVNRLYPDVGQLLDEKFQIAYNLTYNTMAMHRDVDTSMLRRAIWNYIHCMFGIKYDDYDYGEINQLLDRSFKAYIKTVVCSPEKTTKRMYDSFWRQFKHSEKIFIADAESSEPGFG